MKRKPVSGNVRNIERSKKKFLSAVGKILRTKGYGGLKVNDIAQTAGVDKKMIYKYFGGIDGLLDAYIRSKDFWSNVAPPEVPVQMGGGKYFAEELLHAQFDEVFNNKELQKVLLWRLSESRQSLQKLTDQQEENGEHLFGSISDPYFGEQAERFRAVMAILISGVYYLNLHQAVNGSLFCGLDMKTGHGRQLIKEALSFLVDKTYEEG